MVVCGGKEGKGGRVWGHIWAETHNEKSGLKMHVERMGEWGGGGKVSRRKGRG